MEECVKAVEKLNKLFYGEESNNNTHHPGFNVEGNEYAQIIKFGDSIDSLLLYSSENNSRKYNEDTDEEEEIYLYCLRQLDEITREIIKYRNIFFKERIDVKTN